MVFGMGLFVATEVMFFTALISSYVVIKAGTGNWVPPQGVRLPVAATALNTLVLLASGYFMFLGGKKLRAGLRERAAQMLLQSIFLGAFFVVFQGYEWVQLISLGMSMQSNIFAACFYLLIGSHGLHALLSVVAMFVCLNLLKRGRFSKDDYRALEMFWYFIVGVWPLLYGLVYF